MTILFEANAVTAGYPGQPPLFRDFSFTLRAGETWAITGPSAAGKSSLARLIAGQMPVRSSAARPLGPQPGPVGSGMIRWTEPLEVSRIRRVSFRSDSRLLNNRDHYYQERFQASDPVTTPSVRDYLADGQIIAPDRLAAIARQLRLEPYLESRIVTLSTGQTRRAQIARVMLQEPSLLILDEPFAGLDADSIARLVTIVGELIEAGTPVMLLTSGGPLPPWVTHHRELAPPMIPRVQPRQPAPTQFGDVILECDHVSVRHGGVPILRDITWQVRAGERWVVTGANGAGKSTLLSLIAGDHPQAFAQQVRLFGKRRQEGTLAEWKAPIGLASSEFHQYFRENLTLRETVVTGLSEGFTRRRVTVDEEQRIAELLRAFQLHEVADRAFRTLSFGQQRLGLVARALARQPMLLILDEPFALLDPALASQARDWLDSHLKPSQTLLFVGHEARDWPQTLTHRLHLDGGCQVSVVALG